jgi:uncharacterized membrane protein (UPF0127 family)
MIMMDTRVQHAICILLATGALFGVLFMRSHQTHPVLHGGSTPIVVSIADTPQAREHGLSDTPSLAKNTGKLFVFETPGRYGFWMKDMHYALDLVWLDSTLRIVDITPSVSPDTYPQVFYPSTDVFYVLEINAGEASLSELAIGTQLTLQK